eukprot:TRINITY_DN1778_c0_g1_i10.p1 TRINITY_DN1778_c0_g1~~TRINITY_DN1778_c0_g1_i10.p1  ORF type:complete len:333 (+),score=48.90 TRINITY_DN1778_c0_g1_i10:126-1124(+)
MLRSLVGSEMCIRDREDDSCETARDVMKQTLDESTCQPVATLTAQAEPSTPSTIDLGSMGFLLLVLVHALTGVAFFTLQGWSLIDSAYFTVLTLTTIGAGDMAPDTNFQKVFTTFYVLVGFCYLGYALGQVALFVTARHEEQHREEMRQARSGASLDPRTSFVWKVTMAAHGMVFFLAVGTLFYSVTEGWSSVDALYFSAVSLTTVGYGDLSVKSNAGRVFSIFYLLFGTLMTSFFLGSLAELFLNKRERLIDMLYDSDSNQQLWHEHTARGEEVNQASYIEHMLVNSGQIDHETVNEIKYRYQQLHSHGIVDRYQHHEGNEGDMMNKPTQY